MATGEYTTGGSFIGVNGVAKITSANGIVYNGNSAGNNMDANIYNYRKDHVTVEAMDESGDTFINKGGTMQTYKNSNSDVYSYHLFYPYDTNLVFKKRWNNPQKIWFGWSHSGGFISVTTLQRASLPKVEGMSVFDKTLNKPIWFNGLSWLDSNGATV